MASRKAEKASITNLAKLLPSSVTVKETGFRIELVSGTKVPEVKRDQIWRIFETNMKDHYVGSVMGWNPAEKNSELFDAKSRFILMEKDGEEPALAAYSMFRFETEDEYPVLYCYELQVDNDCRGLGLGRLLVNYLGAIGKFYRMDRVLLTVFKSNRAAFKFYDSIGFVLDETSPGFEDDPEEGSVDVDYKIMSMQIPFP